jgi:hypothetical protein
MPNVQPIEHHVVHAPSHPIMGMLIHPRQTMTGLLEYHPGSMANTVGAFSGFVAVMALAQVFGSGWASLLMLAMVGAFFGLFFVQMTSFIVQTVSDRYFGGMASGSQVRTALSWSLIPMTAMNGLVLLYAMTPMFFFPLAILMLLGGVAWTAVVMDHALGEAEAYGDGPAMLVLVFAVAALLLAIALAYLPFWLMGPAIQTYLYYGSF